MKRTFQWVWLALVLMATTGLAAADTGNMPGNSNMPPPGTLNYVEGQVYAQGEEQTPKSVGSTYLEPGQVMDTGRGYAEVLLTPGVYLRLGHDSAVRMLRPGLANTQVELTKGSAMVEADELFKENNLSVVLEGTPTRIVKKGLYDFNANQPAVKVLDGEAIAYVGDKGFKLKKGHELTLAPGEAPVRQKFDVASVENDPLYRWSKLRSEYATEANVDEGNSLMAAGGWWGPGWYWDPFWSDFAFMPGWGLGWGPFGFPFFSPWYAGYAPYYGFYGGFYHYPVRRELGRPGIGAGVRPLGHEARPLGSGFRPLPPLAHQPGVGSPGFHALPHGIGMGGRMAAPAGGFRGGVIGGGFHGEGFHGGGFGGFHGGGLHAGGFAGHGR
jgi:hypothetical protein